MRTRYTLAASLLAGVLGAAGVTAALVANGQDATATVRAASESELTPPRELINLLAVEFGISVVEVKDATVDTAIAEDVAAASTSLYAQYLAADDKPEGQYLVEVDDTPVNRSQGLPIGGLVWIIDYQGLSVPSIGGPITEDGTPAEQSTITRGVVLLDAEDGTFLVSHWRGHS